MCHHQRGGSFLGGIVLGALVGAAAALLYAPQTGEETRKMLKKKAGEMKERAMEMKDEAAHKLSEFKETAMDEVDDVRSRARRAAREFKKKSS